MTDHAPLPWDEIRLWEIGLLQSSTGTGLEHWLARIREADPKSETDLRDWLDGAGVSGYPRSLLVHEIFGYPDSTVRTADDLIDAQYADRPGLRPILDAVLLRAGELEGVSLQTHTHYVALLGPLRTFAVLQPTTKGRVDLGLRIDLPSPAPSTRLRRSRILGADFPARIALTAPTQVDGEVAAWLKHAYDAALTPDRGAEED